MDGDAKITRRNSSDGESAEGGSVLELDRSKYLDSYQNSSPMQPGTYPYHTVLHHLFHMQPAVLYSYTVLHHTFHMHLV